MAKTVQALYQHGILLTFCLAVLSFVTWWFTKDWIKISALLWAFVYSIILTNVIPLGNKYEAGIMFCSTSLLRWSIALLGLTISALVWLELGALGVLIVLTNLIVAFVFGVLFSYRVVKLRSALSILIGVGTCICGASAIAATGPAIKAKSEEMGLALAAVTLFGLLALFLYPLLFLSSGLGSWLSNDPLAFGVWSGIGIHETAQVIAAASQLQGAIGIAMMAKSIRIFMIGPMVIVSSIVYRRLASKGMDVGRAKIGIPWFAVGFVILTFAHAALESSFDMQWVAISNSYIKPTVTFLLAWSFAAIGLRVKRTDIAKMGVKAFVAALVVAIVVSLLGLLLVKYVWLTNYA